MISRLLTCGATGLLCYLVQLTVSSPYNDDYQTTHTRQWTEWYNTDTPYASRGDDESVVSIRERGIEVCDGSSPIDAVCREAGDNGIVFNEETSSFASNFLDIPCTMEGIVCRNSIQRNKTCRDYEIRFECLVVTYPEEPSTNLGVIGVAACLSVIMPIFCVMIMHVVRMVKERRRRGRGQNNTSTTNNGNTEQSSQTDQSDLPPSYEQLFGENFGSTQTLLSFAGSDSTATSGRVMGIPSTRLTSSSDLMTQEDTADTANSEIFSISDGQAIIPESLSSPSSSSLQNQSVQIENEAQPQRRSRFPGMHLSIFDLMTSSNCMMSNEETQTPGSPDSYSYIQTPPPTYSDAIMILGGKPIKTPEK